MTYSANEITQGLFQGGAPPQGDALKRVGVDALVLTALEYQPSASSFPGVDVLSVPGDDDAIQWIPPATIAEWQNAASWVAAKILRGKRVLVTCAQGRNRSGFVSALAVHQLTGWDGAKCVALVQSRRKHALTNESFARFISGFPACAPMKLREDLR